MLVILAVCLPISCGQPQPEPADVGSESIISVPGLNEVYIAVDKEVFDEWIKACNAKDYIGVAQMEALGKLFVVSNGTKVLVIDRHTFSREVRILEGNATGKSGWLPYEWLK